MMKPGRFNLAREGYPFILIGVFLTVIFLLVFKPLAIVSGLFLAFTLYFFRDPERRVPKDRSLLVSPADGKVLKVESLPAGPYLAQAHQKISIFMSPMDVHVNCIPCDGKVKEVQYHPGKFFVASLDKASVDNERNAVILETPEGKEVAFVQIAGLVARRIVCYARASMPVRRGERYGLIRFGSRMEVCIPPEWEVIVKPGDKVKATQSALARMK